MGQRALEIRIRHDKDKTSAQGDVYLLKIEHLSLGFKIFVINATHALNPELFRFISRLGTARFGSCLCE